MAMRKKKSYPLNCQKLTAKTLTHSFANSRSHNQWRSCLEDDNMRGDIKTSHDEVSDNMDDIDQVDINMDIVF